MSAKLNNIRQMNSDEVITTQFIYES